MASVGVAVVNGATGERVVFEQLGRDTAGALLRGEGFMGRGVRVRGRHVHPNQEERFEVVEGVVRFRVGGDERIARAGDVVVVPPGTPHTLGNAGEAEMRFVFEFRPALNIETFFENAFGMLSRRGPGTTIPMVLEFSELLTHYQCEFRMAPTALHWLTALAGPMGRVVGYRPEFPVEA